MPTITSTPRGSAVDGVLLRWGAVLFENAPRRFKGAKDRHPNLKLRSRNAGEIRDEIRALTRCDPQVMVKLLSDQKGMRDVRKVLKYISRDHTLPPQDEQREVYEGAAATVGLDEQFRYASYTVPEDDGKWHETFHMELGMRRGTVDVTTLQEAVGRAGVRQSRVLGPQVRMGLPRPSGAPARPPGRANRQQRFQAA